MRWEDEGILLLRCPHGERESILQVLTHQHGLHAGVLRGGQGRRHRCLYQVGSRMRFFWQARLREHLGCFRGEEISNPIASLFGSPGPLAAFASAASLCLRTLPERDPHPGMYVAFRDLCTILVESRTHAHVWKRAYVRWELVLLQELGFSPHGGSVAEQDVPLSLRLDDGRLQTASRRCSGSRSVPFPRFLRDLIPDAGDIPPPPVCEKALRVGFRLTGVLLHERILGHLGESFPQARANLERFFF